MISGPREIVDTAPNPLLGDILGACAGLTWALTVMGLRRLAASGKAVAAVACGNTAACLATLPMAAPEGLILGADLVLMLWLGVFQIGVAYLLLTRGIARITAFEVTLLMFIEPVFSPLWAWLAHDEQPGTTSLIGGAVILAATAWHAAAVVRDHRRG